MGRPDRAAYDASEIDWQRLKAFARRVAESTQVEPRPGLTVPTRELVTLHRTVRSGGFLGFGVKERTESYAEQRDGFDDGDVTYFDFEKVRARWEVRGSGIAPTSAFNDYLSNRLLRHAKGVGLSMRLKDLQNGPLSPRPSREENRR